MEIFTSKFPRDSAPSWDLHREEVSFRMARGRMRLSGDGLLELVRYVDIRTGERRLWGKCELMGFC
jgi:hypothetical protein